MFKRFIHVILSQGWRASSTGAVMPINKVLIANRGEIACRVMRTARKMGIRTVAVYSDADAKSMHVRMADEAYNIGPAPAQDSYLRQHRILQIAQIAGCQAIHPGYGFLSENTEFAELCQRSAVVFIGPPASAIRDMGIKSTSKAIMSAAGVPIIAGYHGDDQSMARLWQEAEHIGFPLMIKAVRGGGGKGMRIVMTSSEFESQLESAQREALKAFGDQAMLLETYVRDPRHIEVQVFGDSHANYVHLFERDCSVQRRHQKIIEEAPAPGLSTSLRTELGQTAVKAAKAVNYIGAGTVEFILDRYTHAFHFMEMNTRLQVEHPITEMVTGTDLVEWQFKVASGEPLPLTQEDISLRGHAFEARIYAENPANNFLPGAGPLNYLTMPSVESGVRIETGVQQGDVVSVHYDPMIAKLVVWGEDRISSLLKLQACLVDYNIVGLDTNVNFLLDLSQHTEFVAGNVHTGFIAQHHQDLFPAQKPPPSFHRVAQAVLALILNEQLESVRVARCSSDAFSPFVTNKNVRFNHWLVYDFTFNYNKQVVAGKVAYEGPNQYRLCINGNVEEHKVTGSLTNIGHGLLLTCSVDDTILQCQAIIENGDVHLFTKEGSCMFSLPDPIFLKQFDDDTTGVGNNILLSPMPGIVDKVLVHTGQEVKIGDPLLVVITMKMENVIRAPRDTTVDKVLVQPGASITKNANLIYFVKQA